MKYGLDEVIAAETSLSLIDGMAGRLVLAGYDLEDLASNATFEEVVHLFLIGHLPSPAELDVFQRQLADLRALPEIAFDVLREAALSRVSPMDALRMVVPLLSLPGERSFLNSSLLAISAFPTVVGTYARIMNGLKPLTPDRSLCHAAHYLQQLTGVTPTSQEVKAIETYLISVCDHGLNASTFTARIIISTGSDLISAITGAVGALKGPLHGGAPGPALDMVLEIGSVEFAESYLREKLDRGERLMGFGHRVYRVRDPRADVLAQAAESFYQSSDQRRLYELARGVESTALKLLREKNPMRRLDTNVEFYTALLLHGLGIPKDFFTPTFAVGRVLGWSAHCLEQRRTGRLIRPQSEYVGHIGLRYETRYSGD